MTELVGGVETDRKRPKTVVGLRPGGLPTEDLWLFAASGLPAPAAAATAVTTLRAVLNGGWQKIQGRVGDGARMTFWRTLRRGAPARWSTAGGILCV